MATKKITIYTLSGFARVDGCISTIVDDEVYTNIRSAKKAVADQINDAIDAENSRREDYEDYAIARISADNVGNSGYTLSAYNDDDDIVEVKIVKHSVAIP